MLPRGLRGCAREKGELRQRWEGADLQCSINAWSDGDYNYRSLSHPLYLCPSCWSWGGMENSPELHQKILRR